MKCAKIIIIFFIIQHCAGSMVHCEDWYIQLIVQTTDYAGPGYGYIDGSNKAGIRDGASREYDTYDAVKMIPPDPGYIILFFPHHDPEAPDYWPPPNDNIYAFDFRPPEFDQETWHIDIYSNRPEPTECCIRWKKIEDLPPDYGIHLVNLSTSDTTNMRNNETINVNITRGTSNFDLIIADSVNSHIKIFPAYTSTLVGARLFLYTFLYEYDGDSFEVNSEWTVTDPCGIIEEPGQFFAIDSGSPTIIADYYGMKDSIEININGEGTITYLDIEKGWNMFSMPVITPDMEIRHALPYFLNSIYEYSCDSSRYFEVETLYVTHGYFGFAYNDTSLMVIGTPFSSYNKNLIPGWHLLGAVSDTIEIGADVHSDPDSSLMPGLLGFNPTTNRYKRLYTLNPGYGFWTFMQINGRIYVGE